MERRRSARRILTRPGIPKSPRPGRRTIPTLATNSKAAHSSRERLPSKRGSPTDPAQPDVPGSNLQQHYAFSFQITTDQKEGLMNQASVEKTTCTSYHTFSTGRTIINEFVYKKCIQIFIIQNQ